MASGPRTPSPLPETHLFQLIFNHGWFNSQWTQDSGHLGFGVEPRAQILFELVEFLHGVLLRGQLLLLILRTALYLMVKSKSKVTVVLMESMSISILQ